MTFDPELLARLKEIDWFRHCGEPQSNRFTLATEALSDTRAVSRACASRSWENITQEAQGNLTSYLARGHGQHYHTVWNQTMQRVQPFIIEEILPFAKDLVARHNLDPIVVSCVKWDVMHGVMERFYAPLNPPLFFTHLMEVYEAGRLPCGWNGAWPEGTLYLF